MTFGERVKLKRESLGLSQEELANKLGFKSRSSINKIEKDINDVTQTVVVKLATALETTPGDLMGWEEEERETEIFTIAAHAVRELTPDEQEKVLEFARFIKSQRG